MQRRPFKPPDRPTPVSAHGGELELPASLVEELIGKNGAAGQSLANSIRVVQRSRPRIRKWLTEADRIMHDSGLPNVEIPTSCGIDGSCVVEHMLSMSIVASAAVRVEGFTPPSESKPSPVDHVSIVEIETHEAEISTMLRGLMKMMEVEMAYEAPHDVVLSDGSVTSQIIQMNQAMNVAYNHPHTRLVGQKLIDDYGEFLRRFAAILENPGDRIWASLPKFTTRAEIGEAYGEHYGTTGWPEGQDDRSVMTSVLLPGEYTTPEYITRKRRQGGAEENNAAKEAAAADEEKADGWHLAHRDSEIKAATDHVTDLMDGQMVFYYRPESYTPALRIEAASRVVTDPSMMAGLMSALKYQYASYAVMEPYPLFMADRMAKSLGSAVPVIIQSALQDIAAKPDIDLEDMLFGLRSYRTEVGM